MTTLVPQRTDHDCMVCCIAMALGRPYEEVHEAAVACGGFDPEKGCRNEQAVLKHLGLDNRYDNGEPVGDFVGLHRQFALSPEFFRSLAWGRRAILTVPSLNKEGGWHAVYFDGHGLFDPCARKTYSRFIDLMPHELVLFREMSPC